ncbi:hypothetical protein Hypma_014226 [Hypsizygus marmoreus]|uniref:Uncharacterized protein n=1 Tax=Hypsizygus marmoreus TaxID=39966 RepID=A0A369JK31_HYPMA|nr:hypothetical protein Hypma_014226 [Hypsizygus marmoreus]
MVRHEGKDYFVNEPALAHVGDDGGFAMVLPSRWFLKGGKIWAKVQRLISHASEGLLIDNRDDACLEIPVQDFFLSYPDLKVTHTSYGLPDPSEIKGLAREKSQLLYNILFLATSNLASPLEMFDAIVKALKDARENGIEAYDCELKEMVLLLPWILAMLGNNPMQSEFSSHIGLTGKCFCRVCHVRGADAKNRPEGTAREEERVRDFLSTSSERNKDNTIHALQERLRDYLRGAPSAAPGKATESGVKDRFFQHFADQLATACANVKERQKEDPSIQGTEYIVSFLRNLRESMPEDLKLFSLALQLEDFDPNRDSPVEILHVVLLGFVKYFWRDAVSCQNREGKETLKARINSFEPTELGTPKPRGVTLVQYAGSLTGRDFRLVLQLAPAVLYGLILSEAYEAWLALCRLAPLVFQPEIVDCTAYLKRLQAAVDDFLAATALWNMQLFNKPKFHILLHILLHIKHFGPPILTATEGFESYNFVIHLHSVHSNRQAPSIDIGNSFDLLHTIWHLVSGGWIVQDPSPSDAPLVQQAGHSVRKLVNNPVLLKLLGMTDFFSSSKYGM